MKFYCTLDVRRSTASKLCEPFHIEPVGDLYSVFISAVPFVHSLQFGLKMEVACFGILDQS
jgi:hypothetical protein